MVQYSSKSHLRKFMAVTRKAQQTANQRSGDYASLTFNELCELMAEYDVVLTEAEDAGAV